MINILYPYHRRNFDRCVRFHLKPELRGFFSLLKPEKTLMYISEEKWQKYTPK